jgi:hypothetical protein
MKVPKMTIPLLVLLFVVGGYAFQSVFFFPTTDIAYSAVGDSTVEFTVDGLRCRGTAGFFTSQFENTPGIESITTYAVNNKAVFVYDSSIITPDRIKSIFETEFRMQDGTFQSVFREIERTENPSER